MRFALKTFVGRMKQQPEAKVRKSPKNKKHDKQPEPPGVSRGVVENCDASAGASLPLPDNALPGARAC
jgi:hypothetical protein